MPLFVLSFFAVLAGFINAPGVEKFEKWFQPRVAFVDVSTAKFSVILATVSVLIALAGIGAGYAYYWLGAGPQRLTDRNPLARSLKHFLVMKYYLDVLYTDIIVGSLKGPIADGVYWVNQHVIDNVLNYAGQRRDRSRPVHVRIHRPARCRRHRERCCDTDRRSGRRSPARPDRSLAVLCLDLGPRGWAVRPRAVDLHVSGGESAR